MKKLLSLSLAGILAPIGFWFAPAQAMFEQNIVAENVEIPAGVIVEETVGYKDEYNPISDPRVMFTPTFTPWGKFYNRLEYRNGRWQLEPSENRIVWQRKAFDDGRRYMAPHYSCADMNNRIKKARLMYSANTYDPYGTD